MVMATATSTSTPVLTPSQQAAREFWRQAGADGIPPFYIMSQYYAQLHANRDNLPQVTAALEQLLTGLAYATDVDTVLSQFSAGKDEELGYWAGRYGLFDSAGHRFDLVVGRDSATLTVPPALVEGLALPDHTDLATVTVLNSTGFSQGVLSLTNAQCQASLHFTLPVSDTSFDAPEPAALFEATAPQCTGTVVVGSGANADTHSVTGKRGAWTQAGVAQVADGDPAAAWYGQYVLLDVTDVTAVVQAPERVSIYNDPTYGLTFQWGASTYGSNVTYSNNVLQCADQDDDTTQYVMQFVAPQAGAAELNLAVSRAGVVRSYRGYWVASAPLPPAAPTLRAPRPRPAGLLRGAAAAAAAAGGGVSQAIDVSKLTAGGPPKINTIALLVGAVGNDYTLTLQLTGCAATDTFTWTVTPTGDSPAATSRATITPSGDTHQTVLFSLGTLNNRDVGQQLQVRVDLTQSSATPSVTYALQFDIVVGQFEALSLTPPVLMPVVVGTAFTQTLEAHGASGHFTWTVDTSALPSGLRWDADSHQLAGTVTDASQVGKAFHLVVTLAAPDMIIDPLTVSLGITVQSAPAVASAMPFWETILLYSAAPSVVVLVMIAALAIYRYRQAKANANTDAVIGTGYRKLNIATRGDAGSTGKNILANQNKRNALVEDDTSEIQHMLDSLSKAQKEYNDRLEAFGVTMDQLRTYVEKHPDAAPDDPVQDQELRDKGYETFGQVESGLQNGKNTLEVLNTNLRLTRVSYNDSTMRFVSNQDFMRSRKDSESSDIHFVESIHSHDEGEH
jgi:hypothetical protein